MQLLLRCVQYVEETMSNNVMIMWANLRGVCLHRSAQDEETLGKNDPRNSTVRTDNVAGATEKQR